MSLRSSLPLLLAALAVAAFTGCTTSAVAPGDASVPPVHVHDHDHDHGSGITLSDSAQRNLGITWAKAEYRVIQGVVRLPGRFVAEPTARHTYATSVAGRVEIAVRPYQAVEPGTLLYHLHSEAWPRLQAELTAASAEVQAADDRVQALRAHRAALADAVATWTSREQALGPLHQQLGGRADQLAELAGRIADLRIRQAEADRDLAQALREAGNTPEHPGPGLARERWRLLLVRAGQLTGLTEAALLAQVAGRPAWATLEALDIRATRAGLVEGDLLTSGTWVEEHTPVLTTTDPADVRLEAAALLDDLARLGGTPAARIVASDPAVPLAIPAGVVLGPVADPRTRRVAVIARPTDPRTLPSWVRPGVVAHLEVVVAGSAEEELAIPEAATIRDGVERILFRRDPAHPDLVHRVVADLGTSDGRWVVVQSGLKEGDQLVLGGIYPLKLSQQAGGVGAAHVHPDGTVHTGTH